jgi:hypothetical protein
MRFFFSTFLASLRFTIYAPVERAALPRWRAMRIGLKRPRAFADFRDFVDLIPRHGFAQAAEQAAC